MTHPSRVRNPVVAIRRRQVLPRWVRRLDVAAGRRVNARHTHPAVDRGYVRLSNVANRSVLWFSIAAGLAVFGRLRAASRGSASLVVASILANLVGKQVFGGDRPLLKDIPVGRRLRKSPTSPSFPSGHSASAAAFATGVALEVPRAGLVIAPVAAAVAYSRLHTGAHWLSDVVGGSALGVAVGFVGKILVPAVPRPVMPHREGGVPVSLPRLPDGEGAAVVANPGSGSSTIGGDPVERITERMPRARLHVLTDGEDMAEAVGAILDPNPPRVLGVGGGDGTVSGVAHHARRARLPLLVLPGGTFNHFARAAGLESVDDALDALEAGEGLRVDVAELTVGDDDPVTVLNAASVGIYPEFVAEREKWEKLLGKWVAAVVAAIRVLRAAEPLEVTVNDRVARVWSLYVGVNTNHPATIAPLQRWRLDDGLLDVRILHAGSRLRAVGSLAFGRRISAIARKVLRLEPALESFTSDTVTVTVRAKPGQAAGFAHDGEVWEDRPGRSVRPLPPEGYTSTLRVVPQGLEVYARTRSATRPAASPLSDPVSPPDSA
jgi:diacylglycerol kinase family enzyme/membrane-associated phospholipid phosphatase